MASPASDPEQEWWDAFDYIQSRPPQEQTSLLIQARDSHVTTVRVFALQWLARRIELDLGHRLPSGSDFWKPPQGLGTAAPVISRILHCWPMTRDVYHFLDFVLAQAKAEAESDFWHVVSTWVEDGATLDGVVLRLNIAKLYEFEKHRLNGRPLPSTTKSIYANNFGYTETEPDLLLKLLNQPVAHLDVNRIGLIVAGTTLCSCTFTLASTPEGASFQDSIKWRRRETKKHYTPRQDRPFRPLPHHKEKSSADHSPSDHSSKQRAASATSQTPTAPDVPDIDFRREERRRVTRASDDDIPEEIGPERHQSTTGQRQPCQKPPNPHHQRSDADRSDTSSDVVSFETQQKEVGAAKLTEFVSTVTRLLDENKYDESVDGIYKEMMHLIEDMDWPTFWTPDPSLGTSTAEKDSADIHVVTAATMEDPSAGWHPDRPTVVVTPNGEKEGEHLFQRYIDLLASLPSRWTASVQDMRNFAEPRKVTLQTLLPLLRSHLQHENADLTTLNDFINLLDQRDLIKPPPPPRPLDQQACDFLRTACNWSVHVGEEGDIGKACSTRGAEGILTCSLWNLFAKTGAYSRPHVDLLGGTYVRCHTGMKVWSIATNLTNDEVEAFKSKGPDWKPDRGRMKKLILFPGHTLIMPPSVLAVHAPITLADCLMSGGMYWDENYIVETLRHLKFVVENNDTVTNEDIPSDLPQALYGLWRYVQERETQLAASVEFKEAFEQLTKAIACDCAGECDELKCRCAGKCNLWCKNHQVQECVVWPDNESDRMEAIQVLNKEKSVKQSRKRPRPPTKQASKAAKSSVGNQRRLDKDKTSENVDTGGEPDQEVEEQESSRRRSGRPRREKELR